MAQWTIGGAGATYGSSSIVAPNRISAASLFEKGAPIGYLQRANVIEASAHRDHVFSVFAKSSTSTPGHVVLRAGGSFSNDYAEAIVDLATSTVQGITQIGVAQRVVASSVSIGDGWYHISLGFRFTIDTNVNLYLGSGASATALSEADTGASSIFFWGESLERRTLSTEAGYLGSAAENRLSVLSDGYIYLPVFTPETDSIQYTRSNGSRRTIDIDQEDDFITGNGVRYYRIPQSNLDGFPTQITVNDNRGNSRKITVNREDRYSKRTPVLCTFLNKNGVLEDLWLTRKSVDNLRVKRDMYYRNVVNYEDFSFDTHRHTNTPFNVVGRQAMLCNTDNIPETQNQLIKELRMSEFVWLTYDGQTHPVLLKSLSDPFKTHVNDKLVQYSMEFEYSNRFDNTVR